MHLEFIQSYGEHFNHDVLNELLDVLENYNPDLVGIESLMPVVIRDTFNSRRKIDSFFFP
jgi:hypothetical protein